MALFPGDMNIGWGFGRYTQEEDMSLLHTPIAPPLPEHCTGSPTCQCSNCRLIEHNSGEAPEDQVEQPHLTDPLLAVSELEERVGALEEKTYGIHVSATLLAQGEEITLLKQRVETLEGMLKTYFDEAPSKRIRSLEGQLLIEQTRDLEHLSRITDLEERLRSLCIVVNSLVDAVNRLEHGIEEKV